MSENESQISFPVRQALKLEQCFGVWHITVDWVFASAALALPIFQ